MARSAKKNDWHKLHAGNFMYWFGQYIVASLALKFYAKNRRFPNALKKSSLRVRGRNISMELR